MQYFSIDRIKEAIRHLNQYDSGWVLGPLVWAANEVDVGQPKQLRAGDNEGVGTDVFLDQFFSPRLLDLPARGQRENLRPIFHDMGKLPPPGEDGDYVSHQGTKIWANVFSQTFVKSAADRGLIAKSQQGTALTAQFQPAFEQSLPATFRFEELLVWLFAFKGFPDQVASWAGLFDHFRNTYVHGHNFPQPYGGRFFVGGANAPQWPAAQILTEAPSLKQLHEALLPSTFAEGLTNDDWSAIKARLVELTLGKFDGVSEAEAKTLANAALSSLASVKRLFLLGDPGTGKSTYADIVLQSFVDVLSTARVFSVAVETTARTSETTLVGFVGLDGQWIPGALTEPRAGRSLLKQASGSPAEARRQVNVIVLNEANRTDAEALLARLQKSLDSDASDPAHRDHLVPLGASGDSYLSPSTFVILTGNSPRDDYGRVEQSRPFKRRIGLMQIPNPLARAIEADSDAEFGARLERTWKLCQAASLLQSDDLRTQFANALTGNDFTAARGAFRQALQLIARYHAGLSYGALRKLLLLAANELAMTVPTGQPITAELLQYSLDGALTVGVSGLLSSAAAVEGISIRKAIGDTVEIAGSFPRYAAWAQATLSDAGDLGSVEAVF